MGRFGAYRIPSEDKLIAFECAARLGSFSRAADELGTTRTSVGSQVATLERQLSCRLLQRTRTGVIPTDAGKRVYAGVVAGLEIIEIAAAQAAAAPAEDRVVVACSHAAHRFFLMPRYDALSEALGARNRVHVVNDRNLMPGTPLVPAPDVILTWEAGKAPRDHVVIFEEAVRPVCSPRYAESHAGSARGPVSGWGGLTFLDLLRPGRVVASWEVWFRIAGRPDPRPRFVGCDSYVGALEAAVAGKGIALGWRHFIERYLDTGRLVALGDSFVEFDNRFCAVLTRRGRHRPLARKCLSFFEGCVQPGA